MNESRGIYNNNLFKKHRPETAKRSNNYKLINVLNTGDKNANSAFQRHRKTHKPTASHDTVPRIRSRERVRQQDYRTDQVAIDVRAVQENPLVSPKEILDIKISADHESYENKSATFSCNQHRMI